MTVANIDSFKTFTIIEYRGRKKLRLDFIFLIDSKFSRISDSAISLVWMETTGKISPQLIEELSNNPQNIAHPILK